MLKSVKTRSGVERSSTLISFDIQTIFGLRPMPPAGDRIGRLTARAIALLHHFNYHFPYITIKGKKLPIYEVYPKQIAQCLNFLNFLNYKKDPHSVLKFFDHKEAEGKGWCFPV